MKSVSVEKHIRFGRYLKDIVFASNDGIITTFAVVAGTVGASLSSGIVLIIGMASLIADGFSMATGNYLGTKSERSFYKKEEAREYREVEEIPHKEREEVQQILKARGYRGKQLKHLVELITSNKEFWVDFMMSEELKLFGKSHESPLKSMLATFFSFVISGSIPLIPYLLFDNRTTFLYAAIFTGVALFTIGALRALFSLQHWFRAGIEMLLVGGFAASIAFVIGFTLKSLLS